MSRADSAALLQRFSFTACLRRGQLRGHAEMRSEELSARIALVRSIRVRRLLLERIETPRGGNRRPVRRRRERVPCPLVSKSRGRVERTKKIQKKSKKERHLPETGALDRSANSTLMSGFRSAMYLRTVGFEPTPSKRPVLPSVSKAGLQNLCNLHTVKEKPVL